METNERQRTNRHRESDVLMINGRVHIKRSFALEAEVFERLTKRARDEDRNLSMIVNDILNTHL